MWHLWTGTEWLRRSLGGMRFSLDGIDYQARTIPALGTPNIDYNAFAKRGDNIVFAYVVGATNRTIHSADNGATWAAVSTGANTQLVATANRFIGFVGSTGRVDIATTGANGTWTFTATTLPSSSGFVRVAAYNPDLNRVVVVNSAGSFYYSDDEGTSWTGPYLPLGGATWQDAVSVRGMIYAYGRFILQMRDVNTSESKVFTSEDGITWVERLSTANFLGTLAAFEEAA